MNNNVKQAPLYLFAYDITHDNERNKVDKILHDYGFRVQKSVYECRLSRGQRKQLLRRLESLSLESGHIRCYAIASERIIKIGNVPPDIDSEYVYFID